MADIRPLSQGLKNDFETAMINEPSVFEPLKFYCSFIQLVVFFTPLFISALTMAIRNSSLIGDIDSTPTYPTAIEIKAAIPARFFKSNVITSTYYVIKDTTIIFALFAATLYLEQMLPWYTMVVVLSCYWLLQGTMFMAIFVVGHDCGHGSFSKYGVINDVIGTCLHSFLLTPFYPWKLSHKHHHKNTGNIDKDEVFYPIREADNNGKGFLKLFGLGFGWFVYLIKGYNPRSFSHFNPHSEMFLNHMSGCYISLFSICIWIYLLSYYASIFGTISLVKYYIIPELIFGTWLLVVTFLHHTDVNVPWYSDDKWNFVKGQLSSIDRNYGWAHTLIHNIGTHQIHHLFSKIPHYHLEEATTYFRKAFPELVRTRDDSIVSAFIRIFRKFSSQYVIADDTSIHVFQ